MSSLTSPPEHESELPQCKHGRAIESVCELCDGEKIEALEDRVAELETDMQNKAHEAERHRVRAESYKARVEVLEKERSQHHVSPSPFALNPVDGTMGYLCILAEYSGNLDEWVLHDDGHHQGWVLASLVEPDKSGKGGS